jgi:hypothetical protein
MLPAGTLIDEKYEIVSTLGAGAFGAVYSANQKQFDRKVALKLLNTTLLQEADGVARFEREAKAINTLKHKNIVGLYGYGVSFQAPYMVMELIEGTSLSNLIARGPIEPMRALELIKQVFEALGCAHAAGVVHRDLKPSNIMVVSDAHGKENIKIIDFGLVKLMPGYGLPGQKLTETGYALGTCRYMAPEQALGGLVDGRVDIYAAGCILYQMLTGIPPFDDDDNVAIMYKHLNEQPQPLSRFLSAPTPVNVVSTFINNCMAKNVKDRYETCDEAIRDLSAIAAGKFANVTPLAVRPMLAKAPARKRLPVLVPVLIGGAVAAVAAVMWMQAQGLAEQKQQQLIVLKADQACVEARNWNFSPRRDNIILAAWDDQAVRMELAKREAYFDFLLRCWIATLSWRATDDISQTVPVAEELALTKRRMDATDPRLADNKTEMQDVAAVLAMNAFDKGHVQSSNVRNQITHLMRGVKLYLRLSGKGQTKLRATAMSYFDGAVSLLQASPGVSASSVNLLETLELLNDPTRTQKICKQIISKELDAKPFDIKRAHILLGNSYRKPEQFADLSAEAHVLEREFNDAVAAHLMLGAAYYDQGKLNEAQRVFEIDRRDLDAGTNVSTPLFLARIALDKGQFAKALRLAIEAEAAQTRFCIAEPGTVAIGNAPVLQVAALIGLHRVSEAKTRVAQQDVFKFSKTDPYVDSDIARTQGLIELEHQQWMPCL